MVIADLKNKILKVLGFSGTVQDQEFKFFKSEGVSSKTYPEAFMEWLSGLGFGRGSLQDRLKEYLSFLGFTGAIQDAEEKALANGIFYDTIPLRVKNILSKYNATLLLPGPAGTVSYWFQPNNYRESTGQTLASVDQQVGLVVDAAGIPGPELVANGDFSNGTTGWLEALGSGASISVASGSLRLTAGSAGARAYQSFPTVVGRSYRLSITKSGGTATQSGYRITSDATGGATGQIAAETALSGDWSRSLVFTATASNTTIAPLTAQSIGTADFDNISVRELPGIHASQATSGFQPYLRQVPKTVGQERTIYAHPTWAAAGGSYTKSAPAWGGVGGSGLSVGKTYRMSFTVSAVTAGSSLGVYRRNAANSDNELVATINVVAGGSYSVAVPVVTDAATYDIWVDNNTFAGTLTNFSVSEVLEWTHAWQFDGADDRLSLSAVPFEMSDDFFGVFGYRIAAAADVNLLALRNTGQTNPAIVFGVLPNGAPRFWARNDAGTFVQTQGVPRIGVDTVLSGRKYSATMECRVEGALAQAAGRPANALTVNNATLCASVATTASGFFNGNLHGVILGKGAITEAELLTLEKFIAKLQGRSL